MEDLCVLGAAAPRLTLLAVEARVQKFSSEVIGEEDIEGGMIWIC